MAEDKTQSGGNVMAVLFGRDDWAPQADHLPGGKDVRRYMVLSLAATVPCLGVAVYYFGAHLLTMLAVAFVAGAVVELIFAKLRGKPANGGALVFAAMFVLIVPFTPEMPGGATTAPAADAAAVTQPASQPAGPVKCPMKPIPLWMVAAGAAFGIFFGKEIFGGTGHQLFSPVLVAKGFLMFSYPTIVQGTYLGAMLDPRWAAAFSENAWMLASGVICLGAVAMVVARVSNVLTIAAIVGAGAGLSFILQGAAGSEAATQATQAAAATSYLPYDSVLKMLVADGFLFGVCFLACDPASSPGSAVGKVIYGVLVGGVAILMRSFSTYSEAMLSAVLVGNLFAPTIDIMVVGARGDRSTDGEG